MDKTSNRSKRQRQVPDALADVALIDGPSIAAAARMSVSQFYDEVRAGRAPAPVIRQPRFSRWRVADARTWLEQMAGADA